MGQKLSNFYAFLRGKECPYSQLVKYVFCGGISVAVDAFAFYLLAWLVLPCLQADDLVSQIIIWMGGSVQDVSAERLLRNYWIIKIFCFFLSNGVVYVLNALYVFKTGRHHRVKEVALFFSVSALIFLTGTTLGDLLIRVFDWHMTPTYVVVLFLGIIANFSLRKLVVFKG